MAFSRGVQAWQKNEGGVEAEICSIYRMNCDKANAITKPCGGTHDVLLSSRSISTRLPSAKGQALRQTQIPISISQCPCQMIHREMTPIRRANIRGAPPVDFGQCTGPIFRPGISPTFQSDAPINRLLLRYIQRTILMRQRDERRTRLSGVATAASAKPN